MHLPWVSGLAVAEYYACANVLLVAAALALAGIRALSATLPQPITYRHLLLIGRVLAVAALLLPALTASRHEPDVSLLSAQIWSAPSMQTRAAALPDAARMEVSLASRQAFIPLATAEQAALLCITAGLLITLLPLCIDTWSTWRALRKMHAVRRIGRIRVLIAERESVPFALWTPGQASIVLPAALLTLPADLRMALRHEAQHHRQGDTRYLYPALLLRALFGLNPAAHWLVRQFSSLQEYACDEALASRPGYAAQAYCACLLRVAETARSTRNPSLRSCMAGPRRSALTKRIEAALAPPVKKLNAPAAQAAGALLIALLASLSSVIGRPIQDRRISRTVAMQLATTLSGPSPIPLKINRAVVTQLNLLLGTPNGRAFLRSGLAHMRQHQRQVLAALKRRDLPAELMAVPFVESGYRNVALSGDPGAGLWQMIVPTARHYGLEVTARDDERLNVRAETAAATRMLAQLYARFHNWPLAVMAYNTGVARIDAGIRATHSENAWALYRAGFRNDPDYLARTVAMILILAHPQLLH